MRGLKTFNILLLFFLLMLFACQQKQESKVPGFDFANPAYLNLEFENLSDSMYVRSWHWNVIPMEEIKSDSFLIIGNGNSVVNVNVNKPQRIEFSFNGKRLDFLFVPTDTTFVKIDFSGNLDSVIPVFSGKYEEVNNYYFEKFKRFNSWDFFIPRANFTQSSLSASDLAENNDEQTKLELDFLNNYVTKNKLPQWFLDYEKQNVIITSGYFKLNSIFYREYMLAMKDTIPDGYYDFIDSININSKTTIITENYFHYLSDLMSYQRSVKEIEPDSLKNLDKVKGDFSPIYEFISVLDQPAQELYSLYYYFFMAKLKPQYTELLDSLKQIITTSEYKNLIDSIGIAQFEIPKYFAAPNFYLQDTDSEFRKLKEFRGKVVLLNFWSTNCIPCLKVFPFEDTLANKLKNEDFQLINICLNSDEDIWRKKVATHTEVLQLFAKGNWNNILKDSYKIYGYPKFMLVDKNGLIINANAPRPSNPELMDEIKTLLIN